MKDIRLIVHRQWQEGNSKSYVQSIGVIYILDKNQNILLQGNTLELADKNNKQQVSRIPAGEYRVVKRFSPKFEKHFHILDVPNRSYILIHSGNYFTSTLGCLLVGYNYEDINGDKLNDVTDSRRFLDKMLNILPDEFYLLIDDDNPLVINANKK